MSWLWVSLLYAGIAYTGAVGGGITRKDVARLNQKQFYKSTPWKRARQSYIDKRKAIDGGICELCHEEPGYIVHHYKVWLNDINCNDPEISLNEENFQYVCLTCHNKEKDPSQSTPGRCRYGPNGEIIRNSNY